jgi:hypothetical protein
MGKNPVISRGVANIKVFDHHLSPGETMLHTDSHYASRAVLLWGAISVYFDDDPERWLIPGASLEFSHDVVNLEGPNQRLSPGEAIIQIDLDAGRWFIPS